MIPGTKIGNYLVEGLIGRGGMGVVYRGQHLNLPRKVAIKSIAARGGGDLRRLKSRFEREAHVQSQLDHPGIVKIYDYIVSEQTYHIIMEYVEGRSLAQLLAEEARPLAVSRALDLFEQILSAVAYAHGFVYKDEQGASHRGIIHRDLKPGNILVAPDGHVKITDFGIVKLVGADTTEISGTFGSPRYVSPEQATDSPVDQRSDIYSLGVILYEMLTGMTPFGGGGEKLSRNEMLRAHVERTPTRPSRLNPRVVPELERAVCRALEKKPERRFASANDFLRAVRHARAKGAGSADADSRQSFVSTSDATLAEEISGAAEHADHDSYNTQPIGQTVCAACGTDAEPGDDRCIVCGFDLKASPATSRLTRSDYTTLLRRRSFRFVLPLLGLALVGAGFIYFARQSSKPQSETAQTRTPEPRSTSNTSDETRQTVLPTLPPESLVEVRPRRVEVDSSFEGYNAAPLTDGVIDVRRIASLRYNRGNWASAETPVPHWIELSFERPERVAAVYVYWGFDRTRFVASRRVELQTPEEGGAWRTVSTLKPGDDYERTAFEFAPLETSRLRIFQPAQQGPAGRPFVMWVREIQVFALPRSS
ncbi:MAG TPA: protein kinase [Pyrinomonadaceae bacterium]